MENEQFMFSKQIKCLLGHLKTMGLRENFDQMAPASFLPVYCTYSHYTVVIYADNSS